MTQPTAVRAAAACLPLLRALACGSCVLAVSWRCLRARLWCNKATLEAESRGLLFRPPTCNKGLLQLSVDLVVFLEICFVFFLRLVFFADLTASDEPFFYFFIGACRADVFLLRLCF